ncbi:unnamed protein product, partial [Mesorhabditis spiculigera]
MATKKFINEPDDVVDHALHGLVKTNEKLRYHPSCSRVILRTDYKDYLEGGKVALLAGGGSGHEPFPAGFIGSGLLTGAICGNVFASPPSQHVFAALDETRGKAGTVLFIINYTGDRLNFGFAVEKYKRAGGKARVVVIADDVAFDTGENRIGSRGLAGCTLVMKIAGAMAEQGKSMDEIADFAEKMNAGCATLGVSLYPCSLPGRPAMFELEEGKMEVGLGVHGEPGKKREDVREVRKLIRQIMDQILQSKTIGGTEKRLVLLLNNLGAVSQLEMGVLRGEVANYAEAKSLDIALFFHGTMMTSLDGKGISLTALRVDDEAVKMLEAETAAEGWTRPHKGFAITTFEQREVEDDAGMEGLEKKGAKLNSDESWLLRNCVEAACQAMLDNREKLDELDGAAGDGDCGQTMAQAAKAIQKAAGDLSWEYPSTLFSQLALIFQGSIGGTGGAIYALLLESASDSFETSAHPRDFGQGLRKGIETVMKYGRAKPGDRTMVDTLHAVAEAMSSDFSATKETVSELCNIANEAAEKTAEMKAHAGRAAYTAEDVQTKPDAGATAAAIWIEAIGKKFEEKRK